jgi:hypothetical protein
VIDGLAPPIDPFILLGQIVRYCLSDSQAADLTLGQQFMNVRYCAHQIVRLMEFSSTALQIKQPIRSVARAFNIDHSAVKRGILCGYEDLPGRGRHRELSAEIGQGLVGWIVTKAHNHKAVNQTGPLDYCIKNLGTAITRGWVDSFLSRHDNDIFETKSSPQENQRLEVPRAFLEAGIEDTKTQIQNARAELVFNLGEIGISEWEDRIERKVMILSPMRDEKISMGFAGN